MKKKLIYLVVPILLSSCLAEQSNPLTIATCHDGIKNQNEEDIDCGGKCQACEVIVPVEVPCKSTLVNNRIVRNGVNINLTPDDDYISGQKSDHYEILIYKDDFQITINFYVSEMPTKLTAFPITPWYDDEEGYASINYIQFYTYNALSGEVYVSRQNNQLIVEFCSIELQGQGSPIVLTGRIMCN